MKSIDESPKIFRPATSQSLLPSAAAAPIRAGEAHPIHLLTRRNVDDVIAQISYLLNSPSYSREILNFLKLAIILPTLYLGLFDISMGKQALSKNILSSLRSPLNYAWEKFAPDYGVQKSIKDCAEQLSCWWSCR